MREGTFNRHKGYSQNAFLGKINIDSMTIESSFSHETKIKERIGTFNRHTVDIYFDKKGVLTIIQYTV
jgi:hypothetical protein